MRVSHSRVEVFDRCPYKYRLRYVEGIDTIPNTDADNALILGTALHTGIEEGVEQALDFYKNSFPVLTDDHIHEMMKLEAMIPKAKAMLPPGGTFELPIGNADFIGFMDYLVPVGKGLKLDGLITGEDLDEFEAFDLYDFKYSNNAKNYAVSGQLHEYKYWYELTHPGHRIRNMYFLIVPKPKIRQKSTETLSQFRDRLQAALKDAEPTLMPVQYNPMKIVDFLTDVKHMVEATDFPKNPNHFCGWCEYEEYCQKGWDYMLLPKNERRDLNATKKKVVWLYGAPFSGKTFFANQFPDPLMLNTDGNIKFVDAPISPFVTPLRWKAVSPSASWPMKCSWMPWPNWKRNRTISEPSWLTFWKMFMNRAGFTSVTVRAGSMNLMIPSVHGIWSEVSS